MSYPAYYTNGIPGRDWNILDTQLTVTTVLDIEQDIISLLRYLQQNPGQLSDTWLFKAGGLAILTDERAAESEAFRSKMIASGSFILAVTGLYVFAVQLRTMQITAQALNLSPELAQKRFDLCDLIRDSKIPMASKPLDNEFLDLLIALMPKTLELSTIGLDAYRYSPGSASTSTAFSHNGTTASYSSATASYSSTSASYNGAKKDRSKGLILLGIFLLFAPIYAFIKFRIESSSYVYNKEFFIISCFFAIPGLILLLLGLKKR